MFTDLMRPPIALRAVQLFMGTPLSREAGFEQSPQGLAVARLRTEPRWRFKVLGNLPLDKLDDAQRDFWYEQLGKMQHHQASLDGLVWFRDDVVIEDFLLFERLAEAWTRHDSIVLRSAQGEVVFWALSRAGARRWLQPSPEPSALPEAAQNARRAVPVQAAFPAEDLQRAEASGVASVAWSLGVSMLVPTEAGRKRVMPLVPPPDALGELPPLHVVCATRHDQDSFLSQTLTGQSLQRMKQAGVNIRTTVACNNEAGLPQIYNKSIQEKHKDAILLFVHDDVWINDLWLAQRLHEGLLRYDVIGVAGNRHRAPNQPGWAFPKRKGEWEPPQNLLGQVAHIIGKDKLQHAKAKVSRYGTAQRGPARLLDGVLLAARCEVLLRSNVRFDERFRFHFYDLDFCRTAEQRGLRCGVWPLAITHASAGRFGGPDWLAAYGTYVGKWQDA